MEIPILSLSSKTTPYLGSCCVSSSSSNSNFRLLCEFGARKRRMSVRCAKASVERTGEAAIEERESFTGSAMGVTTLDQSFGEDFPVWDKIGAVVRLSYGIGIYGGMVLAGRFICSITGIDCMGGFHPSLDAILEGLGYAAPPIMALLFILDDEVVKLSPHARAIRDVEDEELRSFFYGMSPWQFILMVAASSVGEELFYRAAVQGALADIFLRGTELVSDARGMAALVYILFYELYILICDWCATSLCSICSGICSSNNCCSYRFSILCGCLSERSYLRSCTSSTIRFCS
ncbi:hypothetical protein ES319_D08G192900v1 [Gossypium barbadense]|uniref:Uncharacterized protein n=1 Tax=Gossypium barbadense TaxID=3634 RepID=A0A5J5QI34_GOSBA|nr:hypothetical protein ES319_D08G192900v1 [Gossypium barbadense]